MRGRLLRIALGLATLFSLGALAAAPQSDAGSANVVRVDSGSLRGGASDRDSSVRVYRGVPYAAPPVGRLRWKPPALPESWPGVREAATFAPPCAQLERPGQADAKLLGAEDCLYLNVWSAGAPGDRRPVLVWIHGGGMRRGSASDPARDGSALAAHGLVVVNIAYRLGVLGFFSHPGLTAESEHHASGAYGLLDAIAALQWIHRNIEAFGGDPSNVTVFGQSGGARMVQYLQATPLARGLFQRAVGHSSGTFADRLYLHDPPPGGDSAEAEGEQWASAMRGGTGAGEPQATAQAVAALRALPVERVVIATEGLLPRYAVPVDGWVLPDTTYRLFMAGRQTDVPVLVGWNGYEAVAMGDSARAPADAASYSRRIVEEFGDAAPKFEALYPPGSDPATAFLRGYSVETFGWSMRSWARAMHTVRSPAFYYHFERTPSAPADGPPARHGAELPYVFGNLDPARATEVDRARSELMMAYWIAFAATGDPNGALPPGAESLAAAAAKRPRWAPHTAAGDQTMVFSGTVGLETGVRAKELAFFDQYFERLLGPASDRVNPTAGRP